MGAAIYRGFPAHASATASHQQGGAAFWGPAPGLNGPFAAVEANGKSRRLNER
jgi:hypothetical protein